MQDETYINMRREAAQSLLSAAVENEEFNLVSVLGLVPFRDGNMWCVLWGENIQDGIAGFGYSPWDAVISFNKAVHEGENPKAPTP
ncbi:hypothetical protein [Ruegeria lacuscaerulensis]|uniref:hypothetical protein n=1 Tax=Ruegeria lacuscaerulensis TaxID=55218 RepID=UPI00147BFB02|nr:hypothetical protein [Ruegeria lacuscaerulensis]